MKNTMKRFCFIMLALLMGLSSVSAQKRKKVKSDLVGIWQQVGKMGHKDGKITIAYNPVLKIIDKDGTFSTMFVFSQQSAGSITQRGTYEIQNDSLYTETIREHFIRDVEGSSVPIKYHFSDDEKEVLMLEFEDSRTKAVMHELWIRISDKRIRK